MRTKVGRRFLNKSFAYPIFGIQVEDQVSPAPGHLAPSNTYQATVARSSLDGQMTSSGSLTDHHKAPFPGFQGQGRRLLALAVGLGALALLTHWPPLILAGSCRDSQLCCNGRDSSCVVQKAPMNALIEDLNDKPCYCDHACLKLDDCCSDFKDYCSGKRTHKHSLIYMSNSLLSNLGYREIFTALSWQQRFMHSASVSQTFNLKSGFPSIRRLFYLNQ